MTDVRSDEAYARKQKSEVSHQNQYMTLDVTNRSQEVVKISPKNSPRSAEGNIQYAPLHPSTRSFEIPREHVTIEKIIGKGAFGQVAKATATGLGGSSQKTLVAVKMLKGINRKYDLF